jgi:pimeloyl-ACP methyl ester carboxylesterase
VKKIRWIPWMVLLCWASAQTAWAQLPTPSLVSPANGATGISITPLLDWSTVTGATKYRLFVATSQSTLSALGPTTTTCSGCVLNREILSGSTSQYQVQASEALANGTTHYWMVRAENTTAGSPNSAIRSFTTAAALSAPTLTSPGNGATGISIAPLLDWSTVTGATRYRLFVSTSQSTLASLSPTATTCTGCIVREVNSGSTSQYQFQASEALGNGTTYYWMVRAGSDTAGGSPHSSIRSFTTVAGSLPAPDLLNPSNGAAGVSITPLLDWSTVSGATKYRLFVSTSQSTLESLSPTATTCTGCIVREVNSGSTSQYQFQATEALGNATTYYWMVRAGNTSAGSLNSAIRWFTTAAALSAPTLTSPGNGAGSISITPLLTWSVVNGATRYRLFVSTSQSTLSSLSPSATSCTGCIVREINSGSTSQYQFQATEALGNATTYYWMVRAGSDVAGGSPYSSIRWFTTLAATAAPTITTVTPLTVAQGQTGFWLTINGSNYSASHSHGYWVYAGAGINLQNVSSNGSARAEVVSSSQVRVYVTSVDPAAAVGYRTIDLRYGSGTSEKVSKSNAFQVIAVPSVARFQFAPISTPQEVDVPFSVTISAVTANGSLVSDFTGDVRLSCSYAKVSPDLVRFTAGRWTGIVSLDFNVDDTTLRASFGSLYGESSRFTVVSPEPVTGGIDGKVFNHYGTPDAIVALFNSDGLQINSTHSSPEGRFFFWNLYPGTYFLEARQSETSRSVRQPVTVPGGGSVSVVLTLVQRKRAVVIVPGMMGSTLRSWNWVIRYPELPKNMAEPDQLEILDPGSLLGFASLEEDLRSHGYEVFTAPWDWRIATGINEAQTPGPRQPWAWEIFLKPVIDRAKEATGSEEVDIVAHSMGGILALSYIESINYDHDVDKLALVGTPNHGAALAYYVVEGGEPKRAGDLVNDPHEFYATVSERLYETMEDDAPESRKDLRDFYYKEVRAAVQLLPVYSGALTGGVVSHLSHINTLLPRLNGPEACELLTFENGSSLKVRTKLFLSGSEATLKTVKVGPPGTDGAYPWGEPLSDSEQELPTEGDGTVISSLPDPEEEFSCISRLVSSKGSHAFLVGQFKAELLEFLDAGRTDVGFKPGFVAESVEKSLAPVSLFAVAVNGRTQLALLDPLGHRSGLNEQSGIVEELIPGSTVELGASASGVRVVDPVSGRYVIELAGPHGDNEGLRVSFSYWRGEERFEKSFRLLYHGGAESFTVQLDTTAPSPVGLTSRLLHPSSLSAHEEQGGTVLAWQPSLTPGAVEYRVYGRRTNEPSWLLLGSTPGTFFRTGHTFLERGSEPTWLYTVLGRSASGEESIFFDVVSNVRSTRNPTFSDVPSSFWAFPYVEALFDAGVTTGCAVQQYCPAQQVTRDQMAIFLERALRGRDYAPPAALGIFDDVPPGVWSAGWIEQLYADGITGGCAVTPLRYCPSSPVTRDQMAVFLLRARHGADYAPPPPTGVFSDVPAGFWTEAWIEQLYREGITAGCATSPLRYCPGQVVNRAEMAAFLTRAFALPLP